MSSTYTVREILNIPHFCLLVNVIVHSQSFVVCSSVECAAVKVFLISVQAHDGLKHLQLVSLVASAESLVVS